MTKPHPDQPRPALQVSLFVTCLADLFRPSVAFDSIKLLEQAGCEVSVPLQQTCCGQPAYNTGDYESSVPLARQLIQLFEPADYVVVPSGSCAGMICHHYPRLLDAEWRDRALALAAKTFELTTFLNDIAGLRRGKRKPVELPEVTYHDSCAGLRELGIRTQPRELLRELCDTEVTELQQTLSRLPGSNREARLRFEDQDQSYVVEILDLDSGKVIQQYPPEKLLNQSPRPADLLGTVIDRRS